MAIDRGVLWPMLAMGLLTFIVLSVLFRRRIAEIRVRRLPLRDIATSRGIAMLEDVAPADNFRNLFELPVLFYVACITLTVTATTTPVLSGLAWGYVALRGWHSAIQLTHNHVRRRFQAFVASALVLLALWLGMAAELSRGLR